jgi:hypothetical protein
MRLCLKKENIKREGDKCRKGENRRREKKTSCSLFAWFERRACQSFHMVRQSPRLLKDVNDAEEAELRRLEGREA